MRARILNASAGSGKTYQLAYKYVRVVEQPSIYRHILAVTFTNKATEEMKSRILKEIHLLASGQPSSYLDNLCRELSLDAATVRRRAREVRSKILHDYSRFTVLTIDTFFQRILRAFIKELGIDLNYNVEIETASVLTKSADTLIEQITTDRDLQRWLTDFVQERIDEGKKWDIRDGILTLGGELFKEKNKEAHPRRSREELGHRRRSDGAPRRPSSRCGSVRPRPYGSWPMRRRADGLHGQEPQFRPLFLTVAAGELKPYTATVAK
ncbi:MAG: UvrD-helicase domain-containing protein [Alistipes sp.]